MNGREKLTNLALNRPALQSSTSMFSKGASPAEDASGANNGEITGEAGFHTGPDTPAWWMVDLQSICEIRQICIFNRIGFGERLRHFTILKSINRRHWDVLHQKTDDSEFGAIAGDPFDLVLPMPETARYLKVQQDDDLFLHFDEFQAFGSPSKELPRAPAASRPILGSLHRHPSINFDLTNDAGRFGQACKNERLQILPSMALLPQIPMLSDVAPDPVVVNDHIHQELPPDVSAYAVHDGKIWGSGMITTDDRVVTLPDCLPPYLIGDIASNPNDFLDSVVEPEHWEMREEVVSLLPVASALHQNMVYGHFLLEMLPRLYVLSVLQQLGARFAVALPDDAPAWVDQWVDLYFDRKQQIWFNRRSQTIKSPSVIVPSMMQIHANLHPAYNLMVSDLRARVGLAPDSRRSQRDPKTPRRIYLSRRLIPYHRRLENEDEIEALMRRMGFAIVHPQQMSIYDQLAVFDGAEIVVGEYSSALHNTLFSRPGTSVVSLDFHSAYQSAIGRLRQQPHGFVAPDDGRFRHWRLVDNAQRTYRIDPASLETMVLGMMQAARATDSGMPD